MMRRTGFFVGGALVVASVLAALSMSGCGDQSSDRIAIGFVGALSGRNAGLGVAGRDAVQLAVDERNASGGVGGRQVDLVVVDDAQDAQTAIRGVESLADGGVLGVIGPMTSAMAVAVAPVIDRRRLVMISPTTSTDDLSGKADYFFRVYPDNRDAATELARLIVEADPAARVAAVYDLGNKAHTESWVSHLGAALSARGASLEMTRTFFSGKDQDFYGIAQQVAASRPDRVFIVANAVDTALLCQQLRRIAPDVRIATSEWSSTGDVVIYGGRAVEGILFLNTVDRTDTTPAYVAFKDAFLERFGYEPGFASVHAYDSAQILLDALETSPDAPALRKLLSGGQPREGLQGPISLDPYGDAVRGYRPMTIRDGEFVPAR